MKKYILVILTLIFCSVFSVNAQKNNADSLKQNKHKEKVQKDTTKKWTYNKVLRTDDYNIKYKYANQWYDEKKYQKAMDVYEQLVPHEKGLSRGEEVTFKFTMCNYQIGDYLYAGYLFKSFYDMYPTSIYAEQSLFLSAYCYYVESPRWSLDQKTSEDGISQFQLFISKYPKSNLIDSCNTLIDDMRQILIEKSYRGAKLYYDLEYFKAADVALNNSLKEYPDSKYKEDALYFLVKSNYKFADASINSKQPERYKLCVANCLRYKSYFPEGKYVKEIDKIMDVAKQKSTTN